MADYIRRLDETLDINGVVSIDDGGGSIYRMAFGLSNFEHCVPTTLDTKYLLGSNTKLFTAVAIMQLVERGTLRLDTPVVTLFPDYERLSAEITVHHVLSHTAGIQDFWDMTSIEGDVQVIELAERALLSALAAESQDRTVGEYAYSNAGYYLLGLIIERISGRSYSDYVAENVFAALEMNDSGIYDHRLVVRNLASGYRLLGTKMTVAPYYEMSKLYSCGGAYSTVADINKWLMGLCDNVLISAESFQRVCTPASIDYGYGCRIGQTNGTTFVWHDGYLKGHYSHVRLYPTLGLRMQILRNSSGFSSTMPDELNPQQVCTHIAEIVMR